MDLFKIFSISGSGMAAQKSRMSVVAGNLANSESTRTVDGGPYRRRDVIFQAAPPPGEFADELNDIAADQERAQGVEVVGVKQSNRPPRRIFDPSHPDASPEGYVAMPDINSIEEMVDMLSAVRSYEANLSAFNSTKALIRKILDLGRTQ
ncbi:MAG TPA: flagellar basal body rod protein FlgC [Candidatus Limnocylindria bacterium]|nr:flagellar basal body rod protein FlgC [Candidatus Limnocylindria bacterium]